jgi:hypothetical protein
MLGPMKVMTWYWVAFSAPDGSAFGAALVEAESVERAGVKGATLAERAARRFLAEGATTVDLEAEVTEVDPSVLPAPWREQFLTADEFVQSGLIPIVPEDELLRGKD